MSFDPAARVQDYLVLGEFGDVNPSITDSSTFTFHSPARMEEAFEHEIEGCFLYSRHWNPSSRFLAEALARMEDGESAQVMSSGMAAVSSTLLTLCSAGDEVVSSRTVYGGTYALLKNLLPRLGITTVFVDICDEQPSARRSRRAPVRSSPSRSPTRCSTSATSRCSRRPPTTAASPWWWTTRSAR